MRVTTISCNVFSAISIIDLTATVDNFSLKKLPIVIYIQDHLMNDDNNDFRITIYSCMYQTKIKKMRLK